MQSVGAFVRLIRAPHSVGCYCAHAFGRFWWFERYAEGQRHALVEPFADTTVGRQIVNAFTKHRSDIHVAETPTHSPWQVVRLGAESSAAEKAAWALYDACFDNPDNREAVRAAGAVPALVALLQHGAGGSVPSAAWALAQLMQGSQEAAEVRNRNVYSALTNNPQQARHRMYQMRIDIDCKCSITLVSSLP